MKQYSTGHDVITDAHAIYNALRIIGEDIRYKDSLERHHPAFYSATEAKKTSSTTLQHGAVRDTSIFEQPPPDKKTDEYHAAPTFLALG